MRKLGRILFFALIIAAALAVVVFASGEPSAEPSSEPSYEPQAVETAADMQRFDVTLVVNGDTYKNASVGMSGEGNVYTFDVSELLEAFGASLAYDEQTDTATLRAEGPGLMAAAIQSMTAAKMWEQTAQSAVPEETSASDEPAEPEAPASGEPTEAADNASAEPSAPPMQAPSAGADAVKRAPEDRARGGYVMRKMPVRRSGWRAA